METILIQVLLAAGIIGGLWKLNWTVASLAKEVKWIAAAMRDHETRIRKLEDK